jgi:Pentapeptide repeats (8 copies)
MTETGSQRLEAWWQSESTAPAARSRPSAGRPLSGTDLRRVTLPRGAYFEGANFAGADLREAVIVGAVALEGRPSGRCGLWMKR